MFTTLSDKSSNTSPKLIIWKKEKNLQKTNHHFEWIHLATSFPTSRNPISTHPHEATFTDSSN